MNILTNTSNWPLVCNRTAYCVYITLTDVFISPLIGVPPGIIPLALMISLGPVNGAALEEVLQERTTSQIAAAAVGVLAYACREMVVPIR